MKKEEDNDDNEEEEEDRRAGRARVLAKDEESYADMMEKALSLSAQEAKQVRENARERAQLFSDEEFVAALRSSISKYF